jgi:hypothetical protein
MKKAICFLIIISLVIQGGNNMAYARTKKLTDANYSPTIAASETAIRSQVDGSIQEVLDIVETNYASITESKLDKTGNFTGTWHGLMPTQAEPGLTATVNAHLADNAAHGLGNHVVDNNKHANFTYNGLRYIINNPYEGAGELSLKGFLHGHTTNSDGELTPAQLGTALKNAGFNFYTITDHDFITDNPVVDGITWIGKSVEETNAKHVVAYDITEQSTDTDSRKIIKFHMAKNKMCSIAHPNLTDALVQNNEMSSYPQYNFTEVYNAYDGATGLAEDKWDIALSAGKHVFGLAVDDFHNTAHMPIGKGYVVVFADQNSAVPIKDALRRGCFYASSGNDMEISVDGNVITITSSQTSNIAFIGKNSTIYKNEEGVTTSSYTIVGNEQYIRVKSYRVSDGAIAWSQPIFIDVINNNSENILINDAGTFIPTVIGSTVAGEQTYGTAWGQYKKIDNMVFFQLYVTLTAKDAAMAGNVRIGGLPVPPASKVYGVRPVSIGRTTGIDTTKTGVMGVVATIISSSQYIELHYLVDGATSSTQTAMPVADLLNNFAISISGFYETE